MTTRGAHARAVEVAAATWMVPESALLVEAREGKTSRLRVCPSFRPVKALNAKISIPPLVICIGCKQDSAEELGLRGTVNCV